MIIVFVSVHALASASVDSLAIPSVTVVALGAEDDTKAVPFTLWYDIHFQFPDPRETKTPLSPEAVVILLPAFGKIKLVALCVSIRTPEKVIFIVVPAWTVPKPVIVVVQLTVTEFPVAVERSVVVAEAILVLCASFKSPVIAPPARGRRSVRSCTSSA